LFLPERLTLGQYSKNKVRSQPQRQNRDDSHPGATFILGVAYSPAEYAETHSLGSLPDENSEPGENTREDVTEVMIMPETKLTRSHTDKMIAGVCGGLAAYLSLDPVLVRLAFVILVFASGIGIPIYLILWVIMPSEAGADKVGADVLHDNLSEMGEAVSSQMKRVGRPNTAGAILILLGIYFLSTQLGWLAGWVSALFWPLALIGAGVYILARR